MNPLRTWRHAQNPVMSQKSLGKLLGGANQSAIGQAERLGRCSQRLAERAHSILGVPLLCLLYPDSYPWQAESSVNSGKEEE